ncbi:unnamed protein product [Bursaphelenchus xylophilus]|uniref:(pine wood nematode) hypothetical protein n=1 Tax=Bursaphelenchus xylophilus TaxID=6326 RepID=A0A1I7SUR7_BURXY|nr:unnamed protein product [Bursaphelenchus xylophilus]CAG9125917.1 unnamed protein product [Bursaphelenchus xylophilus]
MYASTVIANAANLYHEMRRSVDEGVQTDFDVNSDDDEESFRKHDLYRARRFLGFFEDDAAAEEDLDDSAAIPCATVKSANGAALPAAAWNSNFSTTARKTLITVTASPIDPKNDDNLKTEDTVISKREAFEVLPSEEGFLPNYEAGVDIRSADGSETASGETSGSSESHQNLYEDHGYGSARKIGVKNDEEKNSGSSYSEEFSESEERHKRWLFGLFGSDEEVKPVTASRPEDVKSISEQPDSRK